MPMWFKLYVYQVGFLINEKTKVAFNDNDEILGI